MHANRESFLAQELPEQTRRLRLELHDAMELIAKLEKEIHRLEQKHEFLAQEREKLRRE